MRSWKWPLLTRIFSCCCSAQTTCKTTLLFYKLGLSHWITLIMIKVLEAKTNLRRTVANFKRVLQLSWLQLRGQEGTLSDSLFFFSFFFSDICTENEYFFIEHWILISCNKKVRLDVSASSNPCTAQPWGYWNQLLLLFPIFFLLFLCVVCYSLSPFWNLWNKKLGEKQAWKCGLDECSFFFFWCFLRASVQSFTAWAKPEDNRVLTYYTCMQKIVIQQTLLEVVNCFLNSPLSFFLYAHVKPRTQLANQKCKSFIKLTAVTLRACTFPRPDKMIINTKSFGNLPEDLPSACLSVHLHSVLSDVALRHAPSERNSPEYQSTRQ